MKENVKPIDFVISWVDGSDPEWLAQKNSYLGVPKQQTDGPDGVTGANAVRFRDWDNLRYWFRAVETYAPWVNRIHFITWGHLPAWLDTENPKLHIVRHEDYIPAEYLPTFSSHPIELNLHRIPGLAEQFVYFNDDFFLTAPVKPEDFFVDGLPCDSLSESPINCSGTDTYHYIQLNDTAFVNRHFSRKECRRQHLERWYPIHEPRTFVKNLALSVFPRDDFFGLTTQHLPQAYVKSTFHKVWELEPQLLHETCTHRFRDYRDVSQCVFKFYQLMTWNFQDYNMEKYGKAFLDNWDPQVASRAIENRTYKLMCLNDGAQVDFAEAKAATTAAFEKVLPGKSSFEKDRV